MNKDYKAKLLEKAGIYIDCCQLLKCVYKLLFFCPSSKMYYIGIVRKILFRQRN